MFCKLNFENYKQSPGPIPPATTGVNTTATTPNGRSLTPSPSAERRANLSHSQWRFCVSTIRHLRKMKDAAPFLNPVDPIALNIPHYPTIVKQPMDFSTIERKLSASNPTKPDANLNNPRYLNADEYLADVRLVFKNCGLFNGPEHAISQMGKRVESVFDKQIKHMPPAAEEVRWFSPSRLVVFTNYLCMTLRAAKTPCSKEIADASTTSTTCRSATVS